MFSLVRQTSATDAPLALHYCADDPDGTARPSTPSGYAGGLLLRRTCPLSEVERTSSFAAGLGALGLVGWRRKQKQRRWPRGESKIDQISERPPRGGLCICAALRRRRYRILKNCSHGIVKPTTNPPAAWTTYSCVAILIMVMTASIARVRLLRMMQFATQLTH